MRLALVGCGGQAGGDVPEIARHPEVKIVALCDPDLKQRARFGENYDVPEANWFADHRTLLSTMRGKIDAVFCATPDHMHAPVGLAALESDLHLYVQKPLARGVGECRALARAAARRPRLATQMGIQIHGEAAYRTAVSWLRAGVIGRALEVHTFCGKGWGGLIPDKPADPIPSGLDWETYCGVAPTVPFVAGYYHPGNWRRWQNFGTGTLGDMGCHILDPVFGGLEFTGARSVVSLLEGPPRPENHPYNAHVVWEMEATRRTAGRISMHWYHGDTRPDASILPGGEIPNTGSVVIGETGRMVIPHWAIPTVYGRDARRRTDLPPAEKSESHYTDWVEVAEGKRRGPCGAHMAYAAALTETVLLGNVAAWQQGKVLRWDHRRCRFFGTGSDEANARRLPGYRAGVDIRF
jgi:predicted dehydrogenase